MKIVRIRDDCFIDFDKILRINIELGFDEDEYVISFETEKRYTYIGGFKKFENAEKYIIKLLQEVDEYPNYRDARNLLKEVKRNDKKKEESPVGKIE